MNYEQLINTFARRNDLEYPEAAQFIDGFFARIKLGMAKGEPVKIFRFGTFSRKTIKTKLSRNQKNKKIEIVPEEIYPHFEFTRTKATAPAKKKKDKPLKSPGPEGMSGIVKMVEQYYKKVVIIFISLLLIFLVVFLAGLIYFRDSVLPDYLYEKGLTHTAIEEMVDSKYQDIIFRTEEYNREMSSAISNQLDKIRERQKASLQKLLTMEKYLKKKISSMIQPQLKKSKKRAQVKMTLYIVKKNDTLWGISKKYLKNQYN